MDQGAGQGGLPDRHDLPARERPAGTHLLLLRQIPPDRGRVAARPPVESPVAWLVGRDPPATTYRLAAHLPAEQQTHPVGGRLRSPFAIPGADGGLEEADRIGRSAHLALSRRSTRGADDYLCQGVSRPNDRADALRTREGNSPAGPGQEGTLLPGEFDKEGTLLHPLDPFLYWYLPVVPVSPAFPDNQGGGLPIVLARVEATKNSILLDCLEMHAATPSPREQKERK